MHACLTLYRIYQEKESIESITVTVQKLQTGIGQDGHWSGQTGIRLDSPDCMGSASAQISAPCIWVIIMQCYSS